MVLLRDVGEYPSASAAEEFRENAEEDMALLREYLCTAAERVELWMHRARRWEGLYRAERDGRRRDDMERRTPAWS